MNKFLKIILYVFFVTISLASAFVIKIQEDNQKLLSEYAVPRSTQLYLPQNLVTASNYQSVLQVIEEVSKETDTSFVYRSVYINAKTDGHGKTNLFDPTVKSLTFFSKAYTNISTKPEINGVTIQNKPLEEINFEQLAYGDTFFTSKHPSEMLTLLSQRLNSNYQLSLTSESLLKRPGWYWNQAEHALINDAGDFTPFIKLSLGFYAFFLLAYLVEKNKKIMIYRLNGLSSFKISNLLLLREFGLVTLLSTLFSSLFVIRGFSLNYLLFILVAFCGTSLVSYVVIWMVGRKSLANQLNNRSFLRGGHYLLTAAKIYAFITVVLTTTILAVIFNSSFNLFSEPSVQGYGMLNSSPPFGYKLTDTSLPKHLNQSLFQYAEKAGALRTDLLMNASPHLPKLYQVPVELPSNVNISVAHRLTTLEVNDNYLKKYSVLDENGKRITVNQDTSEGILLVSQKYKSLEADLLKNYSKVDSFEGMRGFFFNTTNVRIIWIKDDQRLTVLDGFGTRVTPEVMPVMTLKNAGDIYKYGFTTTNGNQLGLLFPIKGSTAATYDAIKPALLADGELDQFPDFYTPNELNILSLMRTTTNPFMPVIQATFSFILYLGMMAAAISFYFKSLKLKIAIQRLEGASYLRSYWPLLVIFGLQFVLGSLYLLGVVIPLGPFDITIPLKESVVIYFIFELLMTGGMLYRLEKRTVLSTLKGE